MREIEMHRVGKPQVKLNVGEGFSIPRHTFKALSSGMIISETVLLSGGRHGDMAFSAVVVAVVAAVGSALDIVFNENKEIG